jgi:hypothetical protein
MRFNHAGVIGRIDELPGCSQIAVFNGVFTPADKRGKGNGTLAHEQRLREAKFLGYDAAMCTVDDANVAEISILEKFKWIKISSYKSSKTGHTVSVWFIQFNKHEEFNPNCPEFKTYDSWEKSLERVQ